MKQRTNLEQKNAKLIDYLFDLIEKADIPGSVNLFSENVYFHSPVTNTDHKELTWSNPRQEKPDIAQFFKELNEKIKIEEMSPLEITAKQNRVFVEGKTSGTVRSTGKYFEHNWAMAFTIKEDKITKCMHYYDTVDIIKAFRE